MATTAQKRLGLSEGKRTIGHIVIVGGGTSGWLSAAFLTRMFGRYTGEIPRITLVESKDIGVIGVGEATIPTLPDTLKRIGVDESAFMVASDGSFKLGIKFKSWHKSPEEDPEESFWHPFGPIHIGGEEGVGAHWLKGYRSGAEMAPFAYHFATAPHFCDAFKAPKTSASKPYKGATVYAYHMDAVLAGRYLRELAVSRGVERVVDDVVEVVKDDQGFIDHLVLKDQEPLKGDLYLDCTGFRSLLLQQALDEPFSSYGASLLCDNAVAINSPWPAPPVRLNPYTTATALSAGWTWDIPLFNRSGRGYVYSSKHISQDAAELELRQQIGDLEGRNSARHLKMKIGRVNRFWVKNCIGIGLAGGFIEPLESTGIYMIEAGLRYLGQFLCDKSASPKLRDHYNNLMTEVYDETRDFIVYHYCTTEREDTLFWRDNKYGLELSDYLKGLMDLSRYKVPGHLDITTRNLIFGYTAWTFIAACHDCWPKGETPLFSLLSDRVTAVNHVPTRAREQIGTLLDHYEYLSSLRSTETQNEIKG